MKTLFPIQSENADRRRTAWDHQILQVMPETKHDLCVYDPASVLPCV